MEGLEIHPVSTRTVCLNLPYLKPWWVTQGVSAALSCFYNPHQPQIIWTEVSLPLPTPRILKIKGHASHALPSIVTPSIKTDIKMGTYLLFCIPDANTNEYLSKCQLILNGVQSVMRGGKNPSLFSLHLLMGGRCQSSSDDGGASNGWTSGASVGPRKAEGFVPCRRSLAESGDSVGASVEDFRGVEEVTTLLEDEDKGNEGAPQDPDSDDASEDIHKIVLRRLVIDITVLMRRWEQIKKEDNLLMLLLKPEQRLQAWQFLTSWISIRERTMEEGSSSTTTLTRRKVITRSKQTISSTSSTPTPTKD